MKFPRNARVFRGQFDVAPFASVFFLLLIFVQLGSMVYIPGVRLQVPRTKELPGVEGPTVAVAVDAAGQFYFQNQAIRPADLKARLQAAVKATRQPLTLVVQADKAVTEEMVIRLVMLADDAGITNALHATLPRTP